MSDQAIDRYLERVRASLRGMPAPEIEEILRELRGHVAERSEAAGGVEEALRSLGDPEDLARQYRTESVAARAECAGSPIVILHSLLLLRRGRLTGWAALALTAFGYAWALALGAAAIEKVLSPHDVGLWHGGGTALLRLRVDGPGPPGSHELLGWWLVPFCLIAGAGLFFLSQQFGQWCIRRSRGSTRR